MQNVTNSLRIIYFVKIYTMQLLLQYMLVRALENNCIRATRTQPLICVGCSVHYWVSCAINKRGFFRDCICRRRRHTFASLWGACLRFAFASLWPTNSRGDSCVLERLLRSFILFSQSVHLLRVCWIFVKRTYFKSLLKVYYRYVFAESFKSFGGRCATK